MDGEIYHIRAIKRNEGDILNADLSHVIASMGHTDLIMIVNAGYPIPDIA